MGGSSGRAWGKVILLGEHAVVHGVPSIAVGIDRGAHATATWIDDGATRLSIRAWGIDVGMDDAHDLARALRAIIDASAVKRRVRLDAQANLPPGGGLGCSAALGVAVARALDPRADQDEIGRRAMAWERVFHGNPSGVDAAVCARGGCILFQKGKTLEPVAVRGSGLTLCVGSTGHASSTRVMVESVARLRQRRPAMVEKAFDGIASLVQNARLAIEAGDRFALGRLMDLNQMVLSGLFVSTQEIERLCDLARTAGALGAKLTGAGGGGCVVALVANAGVAERVLEAWSGEGFDGFATRVAGADEALVSGAAP